MKLETDSFSENDNYSGVQTLPDAEAASKHPVFLLEKGGKKSGGRKGSASEKPSWFARGAVILAVGAGIYYTLHNGDLPFDLDVIIARLLGWD